MRVFFLALAITSAAHAQWTMLPSPTSAELRGIVAVSPEIAWASGTRGTVLRTIDAGAHWTVCSIPPDAERLDFRGIQATDAQTAIVVSSGTGNISRLYKTSDACKTWTLLFTNPDPQGFFDGVKMADHNTAEIIGDSIDHTLTTGKSDHVLSVWRVALTETPNGEPSDHYFEIHAEPGEGSFAASNSGLVIGQTPHRDPTWSYQWLATNSVDHSFVHREATEVTRKCKPCQPVYLHSEVPMTQHSASAGIFSIAFRDDRLGVAVGGDYTKAADTTRTAAYSPDAGVTWLLAQTMPHGFRSAVAYDVTSKTWIAAGPNGTDISTDDGHTWHPLRPSTSDPTDSDQKWNAISLPFIVGSRGRIGKFNPETLKPPK